MQNLTPNKKLQSLLELSHTLTSAVLAGLDGLAIEIQARAMEVKSKPASWSSMTKISGMPRGAVSEALDRISGAFRAIGIPDPQVEILINLTPQMYPRMEHGLMCR